MTVITQPLKEAMESMQKATEVVLNIIKLYAQ